MDGQPRKRPALVTDPRLGSGRKKPRKCAIYQYRPLDTARHEIRLLKLAPGKPGNKIAGEISHVSLDDNPCFDALSYMWGPPRPVYNIFLDGNSTLCIGRNLRKALDDMRQEDKPRVLWTDAICINQSDFDEREHQVRLMRKIYSSAQVVCAWIDHNAEPRGDVFDDLQQLGKGVEIGDVHDPAHWYPVADIFRNAYWRRLWIQQELILASRIEIYCRRSVFDGLCLLQFQRKVIRSVEYNIGRFDHPESKLRRYITGMTRSFMGGILQGQRALLNEGNIENRGQNQHSDEINLDLTTRRAHLMGLFLDSAGLSMTDPRDRVYGILGITAEDDEHDVSLDYKASILSVYSQVFRIFLARYESLIFLCFNRDQGIDEISSGERFPTWMPDSSISWATAGASQAHGFSKAKNAFINPDGSLLTIHGLLVDKISFVGSREGLSMQRCSDWLGKVEGGFGQPQTRNRYTKGKMSPPYFFHGLYHAGIDRCFVQKSQARKKDSTLSANS